MDPKAIKDVADWMKSTDLAEVEYRKEGKGFALSKAGAAPAVPEMPSGRFAAVASPGVGVFQWSEPGKPRLAEDGAELAEGAKLGVVTGAGAPKPVLAPSAGRLAKTFVDAGQAVEYGQPLFLLETR